MLTEDELMKVTRDALHSINNEHSGMGAEKYEYYASFSKVMDDEDAPNIAVRIAKDSFAYINQLENYIDELVDILESIEDGRVFRNAEIMKKLTND